MPRVRIVLGTLTACATVAVSANPAGATTRCGTIHAQHTTFAVSVTRGHVRCHRARHVLSDFFHGKGTMHGPPNGPAYKQWWSVDGWGCGYGAGGGGCNRGGRRILAEWTG